MNPAWKYRLPALSLLFALACGDNLAAPQPDVERPRRPPDASPPPDALPPSDAPPLPDASPPPEPPPSILVISPERGPLAGGTEITITAAGFGIGPDGNTVIIGNQISRITAILDSDIITVETPPGAVPGPVDVIIFNANGFAVAPSGFSYNPLPTIGHITPATGNFRGGGEVTITGTGFQELEAGNASVYFGSTESDAVTVVDDTTLTAAIPAVTTPFTSMDITIRNANGTTNPHIFRYFGRGLLTGALQRQNSNPELHFVDVTTAESFYLGNVIAGGINPAGLWGLTTADDGTIYGLTATTFGNGYPPSLVTVNPFASHGLIAANLVAPLTGTAFCNAITWYNGIIYCTSRNAFYTLDVTTAAMTPINFDTSGVVLFGGGLAVTEDGTFYNIGRPGAVSALRNLYVVNMEGPTRQLPPMSLNITGRPTGAVIYEGALYVTAVRDAAQGRETDVIQVDLATGNASVVTTLQGYFHSITHTGD